MTQILKILDSLKFHTIFRIFITKPIVLLLTMLTLKGVRLRIRNRRVIIWPPLVILMMTCIIIETGLLPIDWLVAGLSGIGGVLIMSRGVVRVRSKVHLSVGLLRTGGRLEVAQIIHWALVFVIRRAMLVIGRVLLDFSATDLARIALGSHTVFEALAVVISVSFVLERFWFWFGILSFISFVLQIY